MSRWPELIDSPKGHQDTSRMSSEKQFWVRLLSFSGWFDWNLSRMTSPKRSPGKVNREMSKKKTIFQNVQGGQYSSADWGFILQESSKAWLQKLLREGTTPFPEYIPSPKTDYVWEIKGHKPSDITVHLFPTFHIPSSILTSTLSLFSALCYFLTNCTITPQLL